MSSTDEWVLVTKKTAKKPRVLQVSEREAYSYQRELDVVGLAPKLLSVESKNLQADGWKFNRVLKNLEEPLPENTEEVEYTWLSVENKWNDRIIFSRKIASVNKQ